MSNASAGDFQNISNQIAPKLLETLTHELINSVGLISMNFELLSDAVRDEVENSRAYPIALETSILNSHLEAVERSLRETVEVLQLLNFCAIALDSSATNRLLAPGEHAADPPKSESSEINLEASVKTEENAAENAAEVTAEQDGKKPAAENGEPDREEDGELKREETAVESYADLTVPLLEWHVRRFGLPQTKTSFHWTTAHRLDFITDESGIFERGETGLPMSMLGLLSLGKRMRTGRDGARISVDFSDSPLRNSFEPNRSADDEVSMSHIFFSSPTGLKGDDSNATECRATVAHESHSNDNGEV